MSRYLTNYLIRRTPIFIRRSFNQDLMRGPGSMGYYFQFPELSPDEGRLHTCYSPVCRFGSSANTRLFPRLACIKPAASVHPEPVSNSPLLKEFVIDWLLTFLFFVASVQYFKELMKNPFENRPLHQNGSQSYRCFIRSSKFSDIFFQQCLHPAEKLMSDGYRKACQPALHFYSTPGSCTCRKSF